MLVLKETIMPYSHRPQLGLKFLKNKPRVSSCLCLNYNENEIPNLAGCLLSK